MTYEIQVFDGQGRHTQTIGPFANIASARQAILDHSDTIDLPNEEPFATDYLGGDVHEGWFIGRAEYNIVMA